jgi:long-chain acyl-CoA synthetase
VRRTPFAVSDSATVQDVPNLADLARNAAVRDGGKAALRWHDRELTWADLDAQVDAAAAALRALVDATPPPDSDGPPGPVDAPPRVAIALPNVPEFASAYFGTLRAGLVAVPVNPGYTRRELRHILDDSGASILIGTPAVLDLVGSERPPTLRHALAELPTAPADRVEPTTGGEDLAVLLYTSGTSGTPKGAMLSHRALIANHRQLAAIDPAPVGPDDVVLLALPLFHSYGLNSGLGAVAYHGACGVLVERFDPADTLAQIQRHGVTTVTGVPPMFVAWSLMSDRLARAFAKVRVAVCGAAPLDPDTARRFVEVAGRHIYQGYGLTETAPVLTTTLGRPEPKAGSIGHSLPEVEIKLVDADGEDVGGIDEDDFDDDAAGSPGTDPGEIIARGPNLFSGYWPDGRGGPDADGWWPTGDVAYADADGDLFLVDRLGELIIVSGFNVYPREVELVLCTHDAVAEAAAVGVAHPYTGQTVKAYVVRAPGAQVTSEELIAHCERNLARFKCPTAVEFVPALPRSATGKVRKSELEREYG